MVFEAFHGIYEEERVVPNRFVVQVEIGLATEDQIVQLEQSVNYVSVYALIRQYFEKPVALLETLAYDTAHAIKRQYEFIQSIRISIEKCHPPVAGMRGSVSVTFSISE